jgi:hypothetical protein
MPDRGGVADRKSRSLAEDEPAVSSGVPTPPDEIPSAIPGPDGDWAFLDGLSPEEDSADDRLSEQPETYRFSESGNPPGDVRAVLDQLDRISVDLRRRPPSNASEAVDETTSPPALPDPEKWDEGESAVGTVSPYLEERLVVASASMSALGRDVRDLGERWERLRGTAELLERELGNAAREVTFLRAPGESREMPLVPLTSTLLPGAAGPVPSSRLLMARPRTGSAPYAGFTVARYNTTISGLKARRRRIALWTVVLAAALSAALVILAVLAQEPTPPVWLALLPAVWMIPVPFFVLSFFSTQRVLRRNHLDLPGVP